MLALLNNFLSHNSKMVLDIESSTAYLLVQKCGTQSLLDLTRKLPNRFVLCDIEKINQLHIDTITVFIREPVDRYISGCLTQMQIYSIPQLIFERLLNVEQQVPIFDTHTMPQFWFLLRFGINTPIKFRILDLCNMTLVHESISTLNRRQHNNLEITPAARNKIDYAMSEDVVLYDNFLNQTVSMPTILDRIKQEKDYFNECNWYKNVLEYLWK